MAVGFAQNGSGCRASDNYAITRGFIDVTEKCMSADFWQETASKELSLTSDQLLERQTKCKASTAAYLPAKTFGPTKYKQNEKCYLMKLPTYSPAPAGFDVQTGR